MPTRAPAADGRPHDTRTAPGGAGGRSRGPSPSRTAGASRGGGTTRPAESPGAATASAATASAATASAATAAARALVAERLPAARALGARLGEELDDVPGFVAAARAGLGDLADKAYRAGQQLVAPGIGPTLGVRTPLLAAVAGGLLRATRRTQPARLLAAADALARDEARELRWLAVHLLRRVLPDDPERAWQVLRRIGHDADDWITVDTLAAVVAEGIAREPYRWAELEQLVFSPIRWERRLVGSAIASAAHLDPRVGRIGDLAGRGLDLVGQLIGDAEPDVQKALSWALRELARRDPAAVTAFCRAETRVAAAARDGHRAWVLRDALTGLPAADAVAIRAQLAGVRRRPGAPPTSAAATIAAEFVSAGLGRPLPEVPLT